ncbi:hypothetical protein [Octadecabacter arcticus]|uniref:hypothetical protein n=1 Tax=Octadecabacter arcticus TaxID=53946 RepID=UPI0016511684|nr:hypothetical protein [Octadecabacter arcticus]
MVMPSQSPLSPDAGSGAVLAPTSPPRVVNTPLAPTAELTSIPKRRNFTLRANKRETIDWLKFTLEGVVERTHGYAFTITTFARCWIWSRFGPDVASPRC